MLPISQDRLKSLFQQAQKAQAAGQPEQALKLYDQVLAARPGLPEALFQQGRIHAVEGDVAKAEKAFRAALKSRPQEPAIWQALAQILSGGKLKKLQREAKAAGVVLATEPDISALLKRIERGQAAEAESQALQLARQAPNAASVAFALGAARAAQGNWAGALKPLQTATERAPANAAAWCELARANLHLQQLGAAETALQRAGKGPDQSILRARLMRETARAEEGLDDLKAAADGAPKHRTLQRELAEHLASLRQGKAARKASERAIAAGVGTDFLAHIGELLSLEGDSETAREIYDDLLARAPGNADYLTLRGQLRQTEGDLEGARADFMAATEASKDASGAIRSCITGGKVKPDDPVLPLLETRLGDLSLPAASRWTLNFAKAKAEEDQGHYDKVFEPLNRANRLMRKAYPYRFEADLEAVRRIFESFEATPELPSDEASSEEAPIFVSGLPRSGTTLGETVLAAHPEVTAGGEMPYLVRALSRVMELDPRATDPTDLARHYTEAGQLYLRAARRRSGAEQRFTDKAISTFSRIGPAALALPKARFVVLKRDPRDVALSIYRNMFPAGKQLYNTDLGDIGRYARLYEAVVARWQEVLPGRIHVLDYEALTSDPEPHIRALVAAAGLDWDDACLEPHKARRQVATLSFAQVRQPIYRGSVEAWRRYEDELAPLFEALEQPISL